MPSSGFFCARRPSKISVIISGMPTKKMQATNTSTNALPPFTPIMYGSFQMLPKPIAEPAVASIKVQRFFQ